MNTPEQLLEADLIKATAMFMEDSNPQQPTNDANVDSAEITAVPEGEIDDNEEILDQESKYDATYRGVRKALKHCAQEVELLIEVSDGELGGKLLAVINTAYDMAKNERSSNTIPFAEAVANIETLKEGIIRLIGQLRIHLRRGVEISKAPPYSTYDYSFSMNDGNRKLGESLVDRHVEMLLMNLPFDHDLKKQILQGAENREWMQAAIQLPLQAATPKKRGRQRKNG